ncbi:MAG TPA: hypothetical protein VFQ22_10320 [Longimicrobiales bacterium]|nr:hypothetical protein [Longimicrobiales bacterium]
MSAPLRYALAAVVVIALFTLALWPFLEPAGRSGVLAAALIAVPVQIVAFAALVRTRGRTNGFLAAWLGGMALRAAVVVAVAFVALRTAHEGAVPLLLALAGYFFALLLLEPVYFRARASEGAS